MPQQCRTEEVKDIYKQLQNAEEDISQKDMLYIIGQWNAKVGQLIDDKVTNKYGLGEHNGAEEKIIEFCIENRYSQQTHTSNNKIVDSIRGLLQRVTIGIQSITSLEGRDERAHYQVQRNYKAQTMERTNNCFAPR